MWGGGDILIGFTTISDVGRAVANILLHPEETRNKHLWIAPTIISQIEVLSVINEYCPEFKLAIHN